MDFQKQEYTQLEGLFAVLGWSLEEGGCWSADQPPGVRLLERGTCCLVLYIESWAVPER